MAKTNIKQIVFGIIFFVLVNSCSVDVAMGHPDVKQDKKSEWRQLFNGKDLTGWRHVGPGSMSVEDGLIRGHGGMGLLYWEGEKFGNCTIRVVFKMQDTNSNSGVFIPVGT